MFGTRIKDTSSQHVLGIACTGHGASLGYVGRDGQVRASVLDRWTGTKHIMLWARDEISDFKNPKSKLDKVIAANLRFMNGGELPRSLPFENTIEEWTRWFLADLGLDGRDIDLVVTSPSHFATCRSRLANHLARWFPRAKFDNRVEHHVLHQEQAFLQSGFEEAAVVTLDTKGENLARLVGRSLSGSISRWTREQGQRKVYTELIFPRNSAGLFYDIASQHLGFYAGQEGKTMGLAPYGRPRFYDELLPRLELRTDGTFSFMTGKEFQERVRAYVEPRGPKDEILPGHEDVAYAAQALIERIVSHVFTTAVQLTGLRRLAYAGGLALNSVANEIARRESGVEQLYVAPNPGDTGHGLGCALHGARNVLRWPMPNGEVREYLGPKYDESAVAAAIAIAEGKAHVERPTDLAQGVARILANGYIVARFAGRAEYGPRALGNRSILCDPRPRGMKDYLNLRVKHREPFRPFAPAVMEEHAGDWFKLKGPSRYMLRVVEATDATKERAPAVVHVDGTARVQTVARDELPEIWHLLAAFNGITGIPIILNTSFNLAGDPIVETPEHAVRCFLNSRIDVLIVEDRVLTKRPYRQCLEEAQTIPEPKV